MLASKLRAKAVTWGVKDSAVRMIFDFSNTPPRFSGHPSLDEVARPLGLILEGNFGFETILTHLMISCSVGVVWNREWTFAEGTAFRKSAWTWGLVINLSCRVTWCMCVRSWDLRVWERVLCFPMKDTATSKRITIETEINAMRKNPRT